MFTVRDKQWNGHKNGELKILLEKSFDSLLGYDKNLQNQQNFSKYTINRFCFNCPNQSIQRINQVDAKSKGAFK